MLQLITIRDQSSEAEFLQLKQNELRREKKKRRRRRICLTFPARRFPLGKETSERNKSNNGYTALWLGYTEGEESSIKRNTSLRPKVKDKKFALLALSGIAHLSAARKKNNFFFFHLSGFLRRICQTRACEFVVNMKKMMTSTDFFFFHPSYLLRAIRKQ